MLELNIQKFAEGDTNPNKDGGNNANQNGGNGSEPKTYTQEELDKIVNDRTGRATKSALSSFFKQKGLSEEEANNAIATYLDNKAKSAPDVNELQKTINNERSARLSAEINQSATLEAIKQGVDIKSIPYVLKMADFKAVTDTDGNINTEKLAEAIKTVLDDIPALKSASQSGNNNGGIQKIGGDGGDNGNVTEDTLRGIFGIKTKN
ncbi:MAG: hypothetical protein J1E85_09455 [Ruminococcus sp.]|nr:hypothetical protein [Ruminococcus sp.]